MNVFSYIISSALCVDFNFACDDELMYYVETFTLPEVIINTVSPVCLLPFRSSGFDIDSTIARCIDRGSNTGSRFKFRFVFLLLRSADCLVVVDP